jgi:hypothetical protein
MALSFGAAVVVWDRWVFVTRTGRQPGTHRSFAAAAGEDRSRWDLRMSRICVGSIITTCNDLRNH